MIDRIKRAAEQARNSAEGLKSAAQQVRRGVAGSGTRRRPRYQQRSNRVSGRQMTREQRLRDRADYLATLPKSPLARWQHRLSPRHFFAFWTSREGMIMALRLTGIGVVLMIIMVIGVFAYFRRGLEDPRKISFDGLTTKFYDRTGKHLLYEVYGDRNRTVVEFDQISDNIKWATVAIEDKDFYHHHGFSISGIARAAISNVLNIGSYQQGGSTITQQFVKNSLLTSERTFTRKIRELILSLEVERSFSKDEILSFYLNEIPYGSQEYGVEAAAQAFFDKSAKDLTIDEAAMMAALPQAPSYYSPYNDAGNEDLEARQDYIIDQMQQQGYIKPEDADKAKKVKTLKKIIPLAKRSKYNNIKAPHFVLEIQRMLEEDPEIGPTLVQTGGLKIITSLDYKKQRIAEKAVKNNFQHVTAQNGDNIALVSVDNETGQILAMVGSRDFKYPKYGFFNAATSKRQPGSSIKPFDYSELFKNPRWGAGSMIYDTSTSFFGWRPNNFDRGFRGMITLRQALGESRNIPAIKAAYIAGVDNVVKLAQNMGNKSLQNTENLSLAIGAAEVKLSEHTNAYATFARGGVYVPETYVLKIEKPNGEVIREWKKKSDRVLNKQIAYMITDILQDDSARVRTFGANNPDLNVPGLTTAIKTGTTDEARDGWMMGYTRYYTTGVWVGNHDNRAMNSITADQTGPTWTSFMREIHKGKKNKPIFAKAPEGIKRVAIDRSSGYAARGGSGNAYMGLFGAWYKPEYAATSRRVTIDTVSGKIATDCTPERAKKASSGTGKWPEIQRSDPAWSYWAPSAGYGGGARTNSGEKDDVHQCDDAQPEVTNVQVSPDDNLEEGDEVTISAQVSKGRFKITDVNFLVDGQIVQSQNGRGSDTYTYKHTFPVAGEFTVSVEVIDSGLYDDEAEYPQDIEIEEKTTSLPFPSPRFGRSRSVSSIFD